MLSDSVRVTDAGRILLRSGASVVAHRSWDGGEPSVVEVRGWVRCLLRERGKIVAGSRREAKVEGHNVWTNTGREFNAMIQTYKPDGVTPYRSDRIMYIGVGTGLQLEEVNVTRLVNPVSFLGTTFLAPIQHTATDFPLYPSRTTARYVRLFAENELTLSPGSTVSIQELGLFTDGDPDQNFVPGTRQTALSVSTQQAPLAYKSLPDPVEKTDALEFQVEWEIRY